MTPEPIYVRDDLNPAYQLRYDWTGWPSNGTLPREPDPDVFVDLAAKWEDDDIRLLEQGWTHDEVHLCVSVKPSVAPVDAAARLKGRLQHALRKNETPVKFSRKLSIRTVGETKTDTVQSYIEAQVANAGLADPRFEAFLEQFTVVDETVDLSEPTATDSGRYWYNLHMVLVVRDRFRITDANRLGRLRDGALRVAQLKGHRIARLSVMPDHLHAAMRGNISHAPGEIAVNFMNNLANLLGQEALWQPSFYVGTFTEYDMDVIRRRAESAAEG
jgi:REP element-mobilizing transposase RayT